MDDKDKMIVALAIGFLAVTSIATSYALVQFQRYGARPVVYLTEFRVAYLNFCPGSVELTFVLTNTGRDGFAQVDVFSDDDSLFTNNYHLVRGETRQVSESAFVADCGAHTFRAEVTATWT